MKKILLFLALSYFFTSCQQAASDSANETPKPKFIAQTVVQPTQTYLPPGYPLQLPIETDYPYAIDLKTPEGKIINSSKVFQQNGKPTILLFWLTTCRPCGLELAAIKNKFPQWQNEADFNLYAISTDFPRNAAQIAKRVEAGGWQFEVFHDFNRQFLGVMPGGLNGLPQVFVLDKEGTIVYHKRKYRTGDEDILFAKVKELTME